MSVSYRLTRTCPQLHRHCICCCHCWFRSVGCCRRCREGSTNYSPSSSRTPPHRTGLRNNIGNRLSDLQVKCSNNSNRMTSWYYRPRTQMSTQLFLILVRRIRAVGGHTNQKGPDRQTGQDVDQLPPLG